MKLLRNHVFVRPQGTPEQQRAAKSGLTIPNMKLLEQAPTHGTITHVGAGCEIVSVGDHVVFEQGVGLRYEVEGETLLLMNEGKVLAIIKSEL